MVGASMRGGTGDRLPRHAYIRVFGYSTQNQSGLATPIEWSLGDIGGR